jgi:general secretion pathway protein G
MVPFIVNGNSDGRLSDLKSSRKQTGFTFVELMVVMAMMALLLSIALPRYFEGLKRAKEAILHDDLATMRQAIDHYRADKGIYPDSLDSLVVQRYIRAIPDDPITERSDTWQVEMPPDYSSHVYDIHSGSEDLASNGTPYSSW